MTERWLTVACPGTWNSNKTPGDPLDRDVDTHVSRIWRLMPEPKVQLPGLGHRRRTRGRKLPRWLDTVVGGAFGAGVGDLVAQYVEFMQQRSGEFDRVLMVGGSRGCGVEGDIIREMDKANEEAWRDGVIGYGQSLPWCRVDVLVMIDPVLSFGGHAALKYLLGWLPGSARWHFNIDRYRSLPGFVRSVVTLYSLDDVRPSFAPTYFRPSNDQCDGWRRWLEGVHSDLLGYGPNPEHVEGAGMWLRHALEQRVTPLRGTAWPWPAPDDGWLDVEAAPVARRPIRGDRALVRSRPDVGAKASRVQSDGLAMTLAGHTPA